MQLLERNDGKKWMLWTASGKLQSALIEESRANMEEEEYDAS